MKADLINHLVCPRTGEQLVLDNPHFDGEGEVMEAALVTVSGRHRYGVTQGVPDLFEPLEERGEQRETIDLFGSEWEHFKRWGWYETIPDEPDAALRYWGGSLENSISAFRGKAPFRSGDLAPGKIILDAGCGNGRFTNLAAQEEGSVVFAVDASEAAFVAFGNLRGRKNVHIIRGNALNLPFRDEFFDAAFSIGVMQHTGNAPGFLASLNRVVKTGHPFVVNCYGTGNACYEVIDAALRRVITRLDKGQQIKCAKAFAAFDRFMRRGGRFRNGLREWLFQYINLLPTDVHMFDWYAPKVAEHYQAEQLTRWLEEIGAVLTDAVPPYHQLGYDDSARRQGHSAFQFRCLAKGRGMEGG